MSYSSFYKNKWFLNSGASTHFTLFKSDFIDMTPDNYDWVETTNSKALLFIVAYSTILVEHEVFNSKNGTTKVAMSKLWPVYYVSSIQIYLLSTEQILQSKLRIKGNKSNSTFYNKSSDAILSATPNLWDSIQIVRTCILKHNISNSVSLAIKYLDFETLYYNFEYISNKVMYYVLDNIEDMMKICFPIWKHVCCSCTLGKIH